MANFEKERFGRNDGNDTAEAVDFYLRYGFHQSFNTRPGMKDWDDDQPTNKEDDSDSDAEKTVNDVGDFYFKCAEQFFETHYPAPINLLPDEIEARELVEMFNEFKLQLAEELKEERAVLRRSGLRADVLLEEMELDVLYWKAHFYAQEYIEKAGKESSEIMRENYDFYASFWMKIESIIRRAMELSKKIK